MTSSNLWTDGNALAGPLHHLVRVDPTAIGRCTGCGHTTAMAEDTGRMAAVGGPIG